VNAAERLDFWWWGEDEAPGIGIWLERACAAFAARRETEVRLRRLRHDEVLPGFPAAAEAGQAPDLHFFWNGIYLVDSVWRGFVAPLDDLLDPAELEAIGGGPLSRLDGRTYRAGWYVIPVVWVANQAVLAAAGVDSVPTDWSEFADACEAVRARGLAPLVAGDGEGDFSVWWLTHFLTQALDEPADVARLVLGDLDWREERFSRHWHLLDEVRRAGFLDEGTLPRTLWAGLDGFTEGVGALTLASGPMFRACRKKLGEAATVMVAPRAGEGHLAGLPIVDSQGIGISSASPRAELAAAFLSHLHDSERRSSLWESVRLFPADRRWPGPEADADRDYARMWQWYASGRNAPYVPNLLPLELHYRLAAEIGQAVLAGRLNGEEAGELAAARSREWREVDPARAETYRSWVLAAAPPSEVRGDAHAKA
jgi:ABC-type glycerol-3-phosphate transport system substrate-binding protein